MATTQVQGQPMEPVAAPDNVVQLRDCEQGRSLTADALRRLVRNRAAVLGAIIIVLNVFVAIFAPFFAPKGYDEASFRDNNAVHSWMTHVFPNMKPVSEGGYVTVNDDYLLGADALGRDLLSRIIYGARVSLAVAFIGPAISLSLGLLVGVTAGYMGGKVDNLLMRLVDIMYAFPTYLLIILLMAFFRFAKPESGTFAGALSDLDAALGGMFFIFIGIGLTSWMGTARLSRGLVLCVREMTYVEAARATGARTGWIIVHHILPNIIGPLVVTETLNIPSYISYEAFLSFIGLGVNPPRPSWGGMISEGAQKIQTYPFQAIFPALALFMVMFAFNFLGDGLRDAVDPRLRGVE
ncbi:MAG TPA: ABC transporter permease [Aggregatilinea sp.]|jgi:oligopeptide transport system permease protein|uniref:ABC transporter permease n=1 Tax=Aggregatilinea sp. TaxID=2806333 RepID=UPI002C529874|nr:ABC transporter permease [Aggregatilinea sp.]HML21163.1 ABC transporter permease [Aggregatilinea sp.]